MAKIVANCFFFAIAIVIVLTSSILAEEYRGDHRHEDRGDRWHEDFRGVAGVIIIGGASMSIAIWGGGGGSVGINDED